MAGARFISRGIDDNSNVANFVESELIVSSEKHLYSYVQIRGSIPLFWEQKQKGLNNIISIKRPENLTKHVFQKHFIDLLVEYDRVQMVNLVKKRNEQEKKLAEALISLLTKSKIPGVQHIWYDFHGETHGDNFHRVNELMERLKEPAS